MASLRFTFASVLVLLASGCTVVVDDRMQAPGCLRDDECPPLDVCSGPRACDPMTHQCVSQNDPLDCDDSDPCTTDTCDPSVQTGCVHTFVDADQDGYSPAVGCTTAEYVGMGGDCDDANNVIHPAATEQCDTAGDDNCNGATDDFPANLTCYQDLDMDGFHNPFVSVAAGCSCPDGYIPPNANGPDCADSLFNVKPGSTASSTDPFCVGGVSNGNATYSKVADSAGPTGVCNADGNGSYTRSWDYNCDGSSTPVSNSANDGCSCLVVVSVGFSAGGLEKYSCSMCSARWDGTVPACGTQGQRWTCSGTGVFSNTCNDTTSAAYPVCR